MSGDFALLSAAAEGWGLSLTSDQQERIRRYLGELLTYNDKVNLTAETDPQALLLRHVANGIAAAAILKQELKSASPRILDLGAGGGFIGMAVKIAWPQAEVT